MAEPFILPAESTQKTPRDGDQAMDFIDVLLAGKLVKFVQLTPSGLIAEYAYPAPLVLFTTAQNIPS